MTVPVLKDIHTAIVQLVRQQLVEQTKDLLLKLKPAFARAIVGMLADERICERSICQVVECVN
jgi:hypothetical protein